LDKERTWANRVGLVGLFEVEWKTHHHNILVKFLNNWKLNYEHNKNKIMMEEEKIIISRHMSAEVF
jgi:hypothetical protein